MRHAHASSTAPSRAEGRARRSLHMRQVPGVRGRRARTATHVNHNSHHLRTAAQHCEVGARTDRLRSVEGGGMRRKRHPCGPTRRLWGRGRQRFQATKAAACLGGLGLNRGRTKDLSRDFHQEHLNSIRNTSDLSRDYFRSQWMQSDLDSGGVKKAAPKPGLFGTKPGPTIRVQHGRT